MRASRSMAGGKEGDREGGHGLHGQTGIDLIRENLSREGRENFQKGKRGTAKKRIGQVQWRAGGWVGPRGRRENAEEQEGPDLDEAGMGKGRRPSPVKLYLGLVYLCTL